jgi:hypothetical protein
MKEKIIMVKSGYEVQKGNNLLTENNSLHPESNVVDTASNDLGMQKWMNQ